MSGGRFNYCDGRLTQEMFGWYVDAQYGMGDSEYKSTVKRVKQKNTFEDKLISELVYDVMCLIHSYDWYASDDTSEETYLADVKFFKNKWLKKLDESRIKEIIDGELEVVREDLYKALIVDDGSTQGSSGTK